MKMAWSFGSANCRNYPLCLNSTGLHKLYWILILLFVCSYFSHASPTVCSTNSALSFDESLRRSEEVIRGKLLRVEDSQTLVVKVMSVYKGSNATEGRNIIIKILSNYDVTGDPLTCMNSATKQQKYIFLLRKQSPLSDNVFYLQYDGIEATRDTSRIVRQAVEEQANECTECFTTTVTMETNSDADHYAACSASAQAYYCLNGGTCTYIVALEQNSCECPPDYIGQRCQLYNFGAAVGKDEEENTLAYVVISCTLACIFLVCLAVAAFYILSRRKNLRISQEREQEGEEDALTDVKVQGDKNQNTDSEPGQNLTVHGIPSITSNVSVNDEEKSRLTGVTLDSSTNSALTQTGSVHRKESSV